YLNANKNSYHYYEANELAGDLLVALGRYDQAAPFYAAIAAAPWPDYKMRSAVLMGRTLAAQGKPEEAIKQFDYALSLGATGKAAEAQTLAARTGKAKSLIALGRGDDGMRQLQEIIDQAPPEDYLIPAVAYNALGSVYLKSDKLKDALYAYLH